MPLSVAIGLTVAITGVWWVSTVPIASVRRHPLMATRSAMVQIEEAHRRWLIAADSVACPESTDALFGAGVAPPRDGWGSAFTLRCDAAGTLEVVSSGPDRTSGTADDISSRDPARRSR